MAAIKNQAKGADGSGSVAEASQIAASFQLISSHLAAIENIVRDSLKGAIDVPVDLPREEQTVRAALKAVQSAVDEARNKYQREAAQAPGHPTDAWQPSAIREAIKLVGERLHLGPVTSVSDIEKLVQQLDSGALDEVLEKATTRAGVGVRSSAGVRRFDEVQPFSQSAWKRDHKL